MAVSATPSQMPVSGQACPGQGSFAGQMLSYRPSPAKPMQQGPQVNRSAALLADGDLLHSAESLWGVFG